jgi:immune inhibitor A
MYKGNLKRKILIISLIVLFFSTSFVFAMPPRPDMKGELGVQAIEVYLQAKALSPGLDAPGPLLQPTGTYKAIVLLVDFTDNLGVVPKGDFEDLLFSLGTYPSGSMRDYYIEVSYNQFEVDGVVNGTTPNWIPMPQTYAYYVNAEYGLGSFSYPNNAQKLAEDAVTAADPFVDYTQYDNDGDGEVDSLFIVHAGQGAEWTGSVDDIWSHKWQMVSPPVLDGMTFSVYSMEPEFWNAPGDMTIGVYCHEYGHVLGLPDLYDLSHAGEGIGEWGVMGGGSWNGPMHLGSRPAHFCAWSKVELDWVTPVVVSSNQMGVNIPNVENNQSIFRLWTDGIMGSQYFLVENRQKTLFDDSLPGECLLIYHVDDSVPKQDNPAHYKVDVEQADGNFDLNNGTNRGDAGDPWPGTSGKTTFDKDSTPNSRDYSGNDTLVAVKNISDCGPTMTADFYVGISVDIYIALDVKPSSCPNPLNVKSKGVLPIAIIGTEGLDVAHIDPSSIQLMFVDPLRFNYEDVSAPYYPLVGKASQYDCTEEGPDGFMDMTLKFDTQLIVQALEFIGGPLNDGEEILVTLTGNLLPEYGGTPIIGEDVIRIIKKGK